MKHKKIRIELKTGLEISFSLLTVLDVKYLLSNHNGYIDGDRRCLVITK